MGYVPVVQGTSGRLSLRTFQQSSAPRRSTQKYEAMFRLVDRSLFSCLVLRLILNPFPALPARRSLWAR